MVDRVLRIPMLPLLAVQALWVVARAPRFAEAAGPRAGVAGAGAPLRLLIAGDSSAAGVAIARQDQALSGHMVRALAPRFRVDWRLEAENGATTAATLARLRALPEQRFDAALIALGVNDVKNGVPRGRWLRDYAALVGLLRDRFGAGVVCVSGLPPLGRFPLLPQPLRWVLGRRAARFDAALRRVTEAEPGAAHIPMDFPLDTRHMAEDGFHPGPAICAAWAEAAARRIGEWADMQVPQ